MNKVYLALIAVVAFCVAVGAGVVLYKMDHPAAYVCVAGPGEVCASDQFVDAMHRLKDLDKEISDKQKSSCAVKDWLDTIRLRNGLSEEVNAQIKDMNSKGFGWNDSKIRFAQFTPDQIRQIQAQAAPPQPALPAPAATTPKK